MVAPGNVVEVFHLPVPRLIRTFALGFQLCDGAGVGRCLVGVQHHGPFPILPPSQGLADEALLNSLHRCDFIADAHNIVMIGGPGTGKTHLATAIGVQAITYHHLRVRFFSTIELVNSLEHEKAHGKPGQIANRLRASRPGHSR